MKKRFAILFLFLFAAVAFSADPVTSTIQDLLTANNAEFVDLQEEYSARIAEIQVAIDAREVAKKVLDDDLTEAQRALRIMRDVRADCERLSVAVNEAVKNIEKSKAKLLAIPEYQNIVPTEILTQAQAILSIGKSGQNALLPYSDFINYRPPTGQ